jgi:hypothetical protein
MVLLFVAWGVVFAGAIRRSRWTVPVALVTLASTLTFLIFNN